MRHRRPLAGQQGEIGIVQVHRMDGNEVGPQQPEVGQPMQRALAMLGQAV